MRHSTAVIYDIATGLRRGGLLSLCWRDADLARCANLVRRAKGCKGREVPLTTRAREAFEVLRSRRGALPLHGEDPMFSDLLGRARRDEKPRNGKPPLSDLARAEALLPNLFSRLAARVDLKGVPPP